MFIQYMALGIKPTTFRTWVSSHNPLTRAPLSLYISYFSRRSGSSTRWRQKSFSILWPTLARTWTSSRPRRSCRPSSAKSRWIPFYKNMFFKWAIRGLFFVFSNKHYNSNIKYMWKNLWPSNIWRQDLNPWPSERECPPITTRPGLTKMLSEVIDPLYYRSILIKLISLVDVFVYICISWLHLRVNHLFAKSHSSST